MSSNKLNILIGIIIIVLVVGLFGANLDYTVNGEPSRIEIAENTNNDIISTLQTIGNGALFIINLALFQIDGVPMIFSTFFLLINLIMIIIIFEYAIEGTKALGSIIPFT